jgi:hypothetical protein
LRVAWGARVPWGALDCDTLVCDTPTCVEWVALCMAHIVFIALADLLLIFWQSCQYDADGDAGGGRRQCADTETDAGEHGEFVGNGAVAADDAAPAT